MSDPTDEVLADYSGTMRRYYTEPQLQRWEHYDGPLSDKTEEQMRAAFGELLHYFSTGTSEMPLPPKGLPGVLHEEYSWHEEAHAALGLGWSYFLACARNETRGMHNRWKEARAFVRRIEERAREKLLEEIVERERQQRDDVDERKAAKPQLVYFIAAGSGPIKIGMAANPKNRCKELQTSHHEKLSVLVTCAGGSEMERAYHERFAAHRLHGEWFDRHPDILAEIERLTNG